MRGGPAATPVRRYACNLLPAASEKDQRRVIFA